MPSRLRKEEEEDFIDTIALAGAAVTETASNAAYRIQEAMEQGSLWCASCYQLISQIERSEEA